MRKQFQIAAVVSAAALLAIGASMTSFAATGWQEEDGTWVYYNKAEEKVTDKWAKSGDNWFYLDGDGYMATDMLIEDDDDYYYVDANGAMVRNQWIAIDNEDAGNDDDEPEVHWYYFQNNGKAYKKKGTSSVFKKSINGKTYAFNEDAQMLYGWVNTDGSQETGDEAWQAGTYYFGDENDGAMSVGWRLISITDTGTPEADQPGDAFWDEDQDRWFYFKSSGKKQTDNTNKTINGKKYGFDADGRMIADWFSETYASQGDASQGNAEYTKTFMYFSTPEDGARYTKGWFKVVPGDYLHHAKHEDGDSYWYYADGHGKLYANELKTIKSKKYAFDKWGRMKKGLQLIQFVEDAGSVDYKKFEEVYADDDKNYPYQNEDEFKKTVEELGTKLTDEKNTFAFMFFSNDEDHDGSMKTGKQTINLDGDNFTFRFYTSGSKKGQGITGVKDKKIYLGGKLVTADSDNKVEFFDIDEKKTVTMSKLINTWFDEDKTKSDDKKTVYKFIGDKDAWAKKYIAINTSGSVLSTGTKKDGDDYKIKLETKGLANKEVEVLGGKVKATYPASIEVK